MRRIAPVLAAVALVACGREANDDIAPEPLEPATAEIPSGTVDADNLPPPVISATPPEIAEDYRAPMRLTERRKSGSIASATRARQNSASSAMVTTATPAISQSAASFSASTVPNSTWTRSTLEPRNETSRTPAASEIR